MSGIMLSFLNCVTFQPEIPEGNGRVEVVVVEVVVVFVVVVVVFFVVVVVGMRRRTRIDIKKLRTY